MAWDFARELERYGPARGGRKPPDISATPFHATSYQGAYAPRSPNLAESRAYCASVAKSHYENFTVVSLLLPRRLIRHFHAVYAYCRWSDDLADETAGGDEALALIAWWREELLALWSGHSVTDSLGRSGRDRNTSPRHPVMIALRETIRRFDIPAQLFLDLLVAFEQDQRLKRYDTFDQLVGYCRNSANPVGRLVLHLFECIDEERAALSDEVCTGLQLANFWQDVARDLDIGRVYLPAEDRARFGYTDGDLAARRCTPQFRELMRFQVDRARGFFERGARLLPLLPKAARIDVDLFIRGGRAILSAIERADYDVWTQRPEVSKWEKGKLLLGAMVRGLCPG